MTSNDSTLPPPPSESEDGLTPLTQWENLLREEDVAAFLWPESRNYRRQMAKYRTREIRPLPYVHIGQQYFYIKEQLVDWINAEQRGTLASERRLQSLARRMS